VAQSYFAHLRNLRRLDVLDNNITRAQTLLDLAQQQLRLARARFEQGVADNREIVDAQNQLAIAEDNLVEANYQYNLSRVELARSRGDVRTVLLEKAP
jgi:outer membrane protein TolC